MKDIKYGENVRGFILQVFNCCLLNIFFIEYFFQAKDTVLRRLVYLGIKELANIAEDVIIVTSSLTKVKQII